MKFYQLNYCIFIKGTHNLDLDYEEVNTSIMKYKNIIFSEISKIY